MGSDLRKQLDANTGDSVAYPYSWREYVLRALWLVVWATLWKLCWKRPRFVRALILRAFGARTSWTVELRGSVWIELPHLLTLGQRLAIDRNVTLYNLGGLEIGNDVVISQDACLCGGTHDYTDPTYPLLRRKIVVGDYVWIAAGAFIGPGVTIGEGAVIGARAVVMKDVEPWTIVAGNPARVIKKRELKGRRPAD